jgi:nucleotide-binding universal stress UspA family protein
MAVMIKRILVPTDFSDASLAGLEYALDLAERFKAEVVVLFVVEPLYSAGDLGLLLEEAQRRGHEELSRLASRLKRRGVACRTMLQIGTPYQVIATAAARERADLIVMATHGRSGLSHFVMGSVAERVVRTARCPVLTVRPPRRHTVRA